MQALDTHVELGWCKNHNDSVVEIEGLDKSIRMLDDKKESVVRTIIKKTPGLRQFMCVHSVFAWDDKDDWDWFVSTVVDEVVMSDKEIKKMRAPKEIPVEIMRMFAKFNPKPVGYEYHPIRIEYELWGNPNAEPPKRKGSRDPVNIIYTQWEDDDKHLTKTEIKDFIKNQGTIAL